jgi:hypothetical protein
VQLLEYPRQIPKKTPEEDEFDWWRKMAIEARNPKKKHFVYGAKGKRFQIPAQVSYR